MFISNRVFWGSVCIACSCILASGVGSQPAGRRIVTVEVFGRPVMETQLLRIVDARGQVRAEIGTRGDGTPYSVGLNDDVLRAVAQVQQTQRAQASPLTATPNAPVTAPASDKALSPEGVYALVQSLVKTRLTAPESARFGPFSEGSVSETHYQTRYIVTGWVDSQNPQGGMVRSRFRAVVRHPAGFPRTLDEFMITPQR